MLGQRGRNGWEDFLVELDDMIGMVLCSACGVGSLKSKARDGTVKR